MPVFYGMTIPDPAMPIDYRRAAAHCQNQGNPIMALRLDNIAQKLEWTPTVMRKYRGAQANG